MASNVSGPRFKPLGEQNGRWHNLELIVTPTEVTARWDGQTFVTMVDSIQGRINEMVKSHPPQLAPNRRGFAPTFAARGGLGIYVNMGFASFRALTVTPIREIDPQSAPQPREG
jgi:hypothetical protein